MQFTANVGETRRIQANAVDDLDAPQPFSGNVSYVSSDSTIATAVANAGAPGSIQVDCKGIAAGTVVVTASAQDTQSPPHPFSSSFTFVVSAPPPPHATKFDFVDEGLI